MCPAALAEGMANMSEPIVRAETSNGNGLRRTMKRKRFTDEESAMALRQAEGGTRGGVVSD